MRRARSSMPLPRAQARVRAMPAPPTLADVLAATWLRWVATWHSLWR